MLKYLIGILLIVFAASWFIVGYKSCGQPSLDIADGDIETLSAVENTTKKIKGKIIGDVSEEDDNDFGGGEDDLEELDEDEILTEDWDDEEADEDEDEKEVIAAKKAPAKKVIKKPAKATPKAEIVSSSSNGRYLVIGGSFSTKNNAKTFIKQLTKLGYEDAEVVVFDKAKKYHTVSVARFDAKTDATKLVGALKGKGIKDAYVHKKRG